MDARNVDFIAAKLEKPLLEEAAFNKQKALAQRVLRNYEDWRGRYKTFQVPPLSPTPLCGFPSGPFRSPVLRGCRPVECRRGMTDAVEWLPPWQDGTLNNVIFLLFFFFPNVSKAGCPAPPSADCYLTADYI